MEFKYRVLWVDDEFEIQESIVRVFAENDIDLLSYACKSAEKALLLLQNHEMFDAVLLDARFFEKEDSKDVNTTGLSLIHTRLQELKSENYLPTFIYTGQPDLIDKGTFKETYSPFYKIFDKNKELDRDELLNSVLEEIPKRSETRIRIKYKDVFSICDPKYGFPDTFEKDLLKHCFYIETREGKNDDVFNSTRKIMASFFKVCTDINLTPIGVGPIDNYESNDRPKFLCQGGRIQKLVPIYAQNLIDTFSIMQEGSHQYKGVVETVKKGENPFLLITLIYTVFSSLVWLKNFIDAHPDVEKTLEITKPLVDTFLQKKNEKQKRHEEQQAETNNRRTDQVDHQRYIIEKDENGILHAGNYYIRCCRDDIGKEVVITKIADNTDKATNTRYPKFARYEII